MRKCPPAGGCLRTSLQFRGTTLVSCIWHDTSRLVDLLQCSENQKRIKLLVYASVRLDDARLMVWGKTLAS